MDPKLVAWSQQVKARWRGRCRRPTLPVLWLFTDAVRLPDPLPAIAALPPGSGVVFRHDGVPGRAALARAAARLCRQRRLVLVVAGDARLAASLGAGVHLRSGRGAHGRCRPLTSSAHGRAELLRAGKAGADVAFLSPLFPTASHPGAPALGPARWAALARASHCPVLALGGVTGRTARGVPPVAWGAGVVGAAGGTP